LDEIFDEGAEFTVTQDHIALLQNTEWEWLSLKLGRWVFGAPCVNSQRPYGHTQIATDICQILEIEIPQYDTDEWLEIERDVLAIHLETLTVIKILMSNIMKGILPGTYVFHDETETHLAHWKRAIFAT
jgi:hypothetical protein